MTNPRCRARRAVVLALGCALALVPRARPARAQTGPGAVTKPTGPARAQAPDPQSPTSSPVDAPAVKVVVHPDVPVGQMTRARLRALYAMRLGQWANDTPAVVFSLASGHPLHRRFCRALLGIEAFQLERGWDRLVFTGRGRAPRRVVSESEMLSVVASTSGAIGYVSEAALAELGQIDRVRVVEVR